MMLNVNKILCKNQMSCCHHIVKLLIFFSKYIIKKLSNIKLKFHFHFTSKVDPSTRGLMKNYIFLVKCATHKNRIINIFRHCENDVMSE